MIRSGRWVTRLNSGTSMSIYFLADFFERNGLLATVELIAVIGAVARENQ